MAADEEDALFQIAINESVQPPSTPTACSERTPSGQSVGEPKEPHALPRVTIDDMIGRLASHNTAELPGFDDPEGDTWIFIDAAPKQPEQDQVDYEHYVKRCAAPFQLKKETLLRLNSPVINNAFGLTAQFRLLRRRKLVDKLPEGIKFVIDLTPPSEGDDAVWLISSLSCSEGVRLWHHSKEIWAVSDRLVGGDEEYTSVRSNVVRATESEAINISNPTTSLNGGPSTTSTSSRRGMRYPPKVPEYSPIRHRAAIERLLAAAAGADPKLDSATKLWTTFAVAKHLGIVRSPLTDYIVTWLRAYPNCMFLEVLTEVSHIMADQLEVYDLERDTFAMLVGEEALDSMVRSRCPKNNRMLSTFGRKKEDLPENIQTRVEYASKKLTDRIIADFEELKRARWIENLSEFQKLCSFTQPQLQSIVSTLKTRLEEWVRGGILHTQRSWYDDVPSADIPPSGGEDLFPRLDRKAVFQFLSPEERVLTRTFWNALKTLNLFDGDSNLDICPGWEKTAVLSGAFQEPVLAEAGYHRIRKSTLSGIITMGQEILDKLELPSFQMAGMDNNVTPSSSAPSGSSSYVPIEVAKRFPPLKNLAIRPKIENKSVLGEFINTPITKDGDDFGRDSVREWIASTGNPDRPAPQGLADWAAKEKLTRTSDTLYALDSNPQEMTETSNTSPFIGKENITPDVATEEDDALADWAESLFSNVSKVDDVSETCDTTPLLRKTNELSGRTNFSFEEIQSDEKQGTKRPAETYQHEPSTRASPYTAGLNLLFPKKAKLPKLPQKPEFFSLARFFSEAEEHIRMVARLKLSYTDAVNGRKEPHELNLINTLVCLDDSEFKFLPLWAGGCDDDSGGVFNDDVAIPDVSFATAGPSIKHGAGIHTVSECDTISNDGVPRGMVTPTSSAPSSEYHLINDQTSTFAPSSNHTTAGYSSDKLEADHVYATDSIEESLISDDDFSVIARSEGMNPDDEEENARRVIEAMERIEAADAEAARAARQERNAPENDENYADLFGSEEEEDDADEDGDDDGNASDDTLMDGDDFGSEGELI